MICLNTTEFNRYDGVTYGFTIYDNYGNNYDNTMEAIENDDIRLLQYAIEHGDENTQEFIDHIQEHECGIQINGTWYDWDEISKYFK